MNRHVGRTMDVLFETAAADGTYEGKTANYITVHAPSERDISGEFHKVCLKNAENGIMFGKIVD